MGDLLLAFSSCQVGGFVPETIREKAVKLRPFDDGDDIDLGLLWQDKWEKMWTTQETTIEVFEHINLMALDIIMKCAFGQETNCQINGSVMRQ